MECSGSGAWPATRGNQQAAGRQGSTTRCLSRTGCLMHDAAITSTAPLTMVATPRLWQQGSQYKEGSEVGCIHGDKWWVIVLIVLIVGRVLQSCGPHNSIKLPWEIIGIKCQSIRVVRDPSHDKALVRCWHSHTQSCHHAPLDHWGQHLT
jgi:hypothetical protein